MTKPKKIFSHVLIFTSVKIVPQILSLQRFHKLCFAIKQIEREQMLIQCLDFAIYWLSQAIAILVHQAAPIIIGKGVIHIIVHPHLHILQSPSTFSIFLLQLHVTCQRFHLHNEVILNDFALIAQQQLRIGCGGEDARFRQINFLVLGLYHPLPFLVNDTNLTVTVSTSLVKSFCREDCITKNEFL